MECKFIKSNNQKCLRKIKIGEYCWQHIEEKSVKLEEPKNQENIKNLEKDNQTKTICLKVANLRKNGYQSLEDWFKNSENVYVGRSGRIWITESINDQKVKRIFHYAGSKYGNPFKISDSETSEIVCQKYKEYILNNKELMDGLKELKGKTLGCFCDQNEHCHAKILVELIEKI